MGKRLDQQPMYPQYTYYYPHYLQTKVGRGSRRALGGRWGASGANGRGCWPGSLPFPPFLGLGVTQSRAGRQRAGGREAGRLVSVL